MVVSGDMGRSADTPPMSSVDSALRVLLLLSKRPSVRVSDVASHLDVSVSTAHRLLSALMYRKFAEQDRATRAYVRGPAMRAYAAGLERIDVAGSARPYLDLLSRELGETIQVLVLKGQSVKFVAAAESTQVLRVGSRVGLLMPAHCASGGKVLLADLPAKRFLALYPDTQLPSRTVNSITSREKLEVELAKVRRAGYAMSVGEGEADVAAVAVAIRDPSGNALAAIAVSGPYSRMPRKLMVEIAERLSWATRQIAGAL